MRLDDTTASTRNLPATTRVHLDPTKQQTSPKTALVPPPPPPLPPLRRTRRRPRRSFPLSQGCGNSIRRTRWRRSRLRSCSSVSSTSRTRRASGCRRPDSATARRRIPPRRRRRTRQRCTSSSEGWRACASCGRWREGGPGSRRFPLTLSPALSFRPPLLPLFSDLSLCATLSAAVERSILISVMQCTRDLESWPVRRTVSRREDSRILPFLSPSCTMGEPSLDHVGETL